VNRSANGAGAAAALVAKAGLATLFALAIPDSAGEIKAIESILANIIPPLVDIKHICGFP
jgi:hypothetical protein